MIYIFIVTPMGAVRQTRADAWRKRPVVVRYHMFRDLLRLEARKNGFIPSDEMKTTFYLPMPDSWSKKKKEAMNGKPHQQKPDRDNLEKAFMDALMDEDCKCWHGEQRKYWTDDSIGWIEAENL